MILLYTSALFDCIFKVFEVNLNVKLSGPTRSMSSDRTLTKSSTSLTIIEGGAMRFVFLSLL